MEINTVVTLVTLVAVIIGLYNMYRHVTVPKGYKCVSSPNDPEIKLCEGGNTPEHNKTLEECMATCRGKGWKCTTGCDEPKCCELRNDVLQNDPDIFESEAKCAENCTYPGVAPDWENKKCDGNAKIDCYKGFVHIEGDKVDKTRPCYSDADTCEEKSFKMGYKASTKCTQIQKCNIDDPECLASMEECLQKNFLPEKYKCENGRCNQTGCYKWEDCFSDLNTCRDKCLTGRKSISRKTCVKCVDDCVSTSTCVQITEVMKRLDRAISDWVNAGFPQVEKLIFTNARGQIIDNEYHQRLQWKTKYLDLLRGDMNKLTGKNIKADLQDKIFNQVNNPKDIHYGFYAIKKDLASMPDRNEYVLKLVDSYLNLIRDIYNEYKAVNWS